MKQKLFIIEESCYFKMGDEVEGVVTNEGVRIGDHFLDKSQYVVLNEALTKTDEEKVRRIIRQVLKTMFWRLYTRSSFITK